jgi:uncharacterized membrane protein SirB2
VLDLYPQIKWLHIACVILSGTLFAARGALALAGWPHARNLSLRVASWAIDSVLLLAAVLLAWLSGQYPFVEPWLTTKVLLLLAYIGLGTVALRPAVTPRVRTAAFVAALVVFLTIVSVALARSPWGWLAHGA